MANKVLVFCLVKDQAVAEKVVRKVGVRILKILKKRKLQLQIFLVDGRRMRLLSRRFLGKDKRTNVLSFEATEWPSIDETYKELGEVYLDLGYIRNHGEDWRYLLVHGILHLMGYDHRNKGDTIRMKKKENQVYAKLGE